MELTGNAVLDQFPGHFQDVGVVVVTVYGVDGCPGPLVSPGVFTVVHVAEVDHGSPDRAPSRGRPGIVQGFRG